MTPVITPTALQVEILPPDGQLLTGEWMSFTVRLRRPESSRGRIKVLQVACRDPAVVLDTDLLPREVELGPGESYRATLLVSCREPKVVSQDSFFVQYREGDSHSEQQ